MPPVGIFKCIPENHPSRTPTPDRESTKQHEWDTPTRFSVKVLMKTGLTRQATPLRSKQACQSVLNEPSVKDLTEGPGKIALAHLTSLVKETFV